MLTTWILYQRGYDLGKFYALEEFYADNLQRYYDALVTHPHHNYYFGRREAEITSWLIYFLEGMAYVFERVGEHVRNSAEVEGNEEMNALLRSLDYRARRVFGIFQTQDLIRSTEVAALLGISVRHTRDLLKGWVEDGWLEVEDPSRRARKYRLAKPYRKIIS
jgi:Fic family protein